MTEPALRNKRKKVVVAVTGLNAIDSPGPGVAVIRSIRECRDFDVRIIGLAYEALEPGIYMDGIADKTFQIPYPSAGTDALLSRIKYIKAREKVDVLIPNFDAELYNFIKLKEELERMDIHTCLPTMEAFEARDKVNLSKFGEQHGLSVPCDKVIYHASELKDAIGKSGFPVVMKGKFYDAMICNTEEQAEKAYYKIQAKWGLPVIMQEFITGTEVNIAALGDGEGNVISAVPMRKLYITDKGKAWAGVTIDDELLVEQAIKFISATKWMGGCELEIMLTADRKPYIMEVNPRFPAWIYLTTAAGQNQPGALVSMAMGKKVTPFKKYKAGKVFIRYSWDRIIDISEFQKLSGTGEL